MERIRWLRFSCPELSLRGLGRRMLEREYREEKAQGFLVSGITQHHLSGRYVERLAREETVCNPLGETERYTTISYSVVTFTILGLVGLMELSQPPRHLGTFISALGRITHFRAVVSPLEAGLQVWVSELRARGITLAVTTLACSRVSLSPTVRMSFTVRGLEDVSNYARFIAGEQLPRWDMVRLRIAGEPLVTLSHEGVASSSQFSQETKEALRQTIPAAMA